MTVQVIDKGWDAIGAELKKLAQGKTASVGIQGSKAEAPHDDSAYTNVEIGAVHEYGSQDGTIPERSYLRSTYSENEAAIEREMARIASTKVFSGKSPIADLTMAGEDFKKKVLEKIQAGIGDPVDDRIALVKTGQLWNAITSEVVDPRTRK